jgi:hypothetical protein
VKEGYQDRFVCYADCLAGASTIEQIRACRDRCYNNEFSSTHLQGTKEDEDTKEETGPKQDTNKETGPPDERDICYAICVSNASALQELNACNKCYS